MSESSLSQAMSRRHPSESNENLARVYFPKLTSPLAGQDKAA